MSDNVVKAVSATCPECDTQIRFHEQPHLGQLVTCPECGESLEVVRRAPLKLDWAFEMSFADEELDDDDTFDDDDDDFDFDDDDDDYDFDEDDDL